MEDESDMDLRALACFVAVAERCHFGRAAEYLHMTQPQVSRLVAALEKDLALRLFDRSSRTVRMTAFGRAFLPEAQAVLAAAEQARRVAERNARVGAGMMAIGTLSSLPFTAVLPRIVRSVLRSWPDLRFTFHELSTHQQVEALMDKRLDIGFVRLPVRDLPRALAATEILSEPLMLALPQEHPLANLPTVPVTKLKGEPFVGYSEDLRGGLPDVVRVLCEHAGFAPRVVQETTRVPVAVSCVAAGLGIALVPATYAQVAIPGAVYRALDDPSARVSIALAYRRDNRSAVVQTFAAIGRSWSEGTVVKRPAR
jgi:DNA-binding transcriptional LysR family regulator